MVPQTKVTGVLIKQTKLLLHWEIYKKDKLMLKLKFQYFGHLKEKNQLIGKDADAGKD